MAMKIEATQDLIEMINRSVKEWKNIKTQLSEEHHYYDVYCTDLFGLNVDFSALDHAVIIHGATVVDDEKYVNFLLRYGNMPNE